MILNLVKASVHNDARWLVAVGGTLLLTLVFDRLAEMFVLALPSKKPDDRRGSFRSTRATLWECVEAAKNSTSGDQSPVDVLGDEVRLRLPKIHRRWFAHHDPAIATLICLAPLAGMATTLVRLCVDPRPTAMVGEALAPTVVGIVISMAASMLSLAMQLFDFPARMTREFTFRSAATKPSVRSVILRSHAAPVMAVVFFIAFGDFLLGLWVRSLSVMQMDGQAAPQVAGRVANDGLSALPVYLELAASPERFTLAGNILPTEASKVDEAVERIVAARLLHGLPPPLTRIVVHSRPEVTVGDLQHAKAAIQTAVLRRAGQNTTVRFEDCVDLSSTKDGTCQEKAS